MSRVQKFNKAIGAIVGGVTAILGIYGFDVPVEPEAMGAIVTGLAGLGALLAPKNKEN